MMTYRFRSERIHVIQALLSGDGSFVDLRYRLSRADKALGRFSVHIVDEETGKRLELVRLAKFGTVRTRHNRLQSLGILLFYNRDKIIRNGSMVTLFFDKLRAEHVEVCEYRRTENRESENQRIDACKKRCAFSLFSNLFLLSGIILHACTYLHWNGSLFYVKIFAAIYYRKLLYMKRGKKCVV